MSFLFSQELANSERLKRQLQTERDELQDEVNSTNTKKYEPNSHSLIFEIAFE